MLAPREYASTSAVWGAGGGVVVGGGVWVCVQRARVRARTSRFTSASNQVEIVTRRVRYAVNQRSVGCIEKV